MLVLILTVTWQAAFANELPVERPDTNTIILPAEGMTFRRISPQQYGKPGEDFFLLVTEVSNEIYARHLKDTGQTKLDQWFAQRQEERRQVELKRGQTVPSSTAGPYTRLQNKSLLWVYDQPPAGKTQYPVALVDYYEARAFCVWLCKRYPSLGLFRFPKIEEWLVAAYGKDRDYPWGNTWDPKIPVVSVSEGNRRKEPVALDQPTRDRTPEGICHLWGNVREWSFAPWDSPSIEDVDSTKHYGDTAFMGGDFATTLKKEWYKPRQNYWGYVHSPLSRSEECGFRVLLEPKGSSQKPLPPLPDK